MSFKASEIADRVSTVLYDEDRVRWTESELVRWISDGCDALLRDLPEAGAESAVRRLDAGKTRQEFPDVRRILEIERNVDGQGNPTGPGITITTRHAMDICRSNWHLDKGEFVQQWLYEPEHNPRVFWVYPAPEEAIYVQGMIVPDQTISSLAQTIKISRKWLTAVTDYVLFRTLSKNSDFGGNMQRATAHLSSFYTAIGREEKARALADPNTTMERRNSGQVQ